MVTKRKNSAPTTRDDVIEGDESKHTHQPSVSNALKIKIDHLKTFEALTENQGLFFDMYKGGGYFIGLFGSPGVGKTFLAMYRSIEEVLQKDNPFKQVVVVRSLVQLREIGHLPGDLEEKQEIYELPYKEICTTLFGRPDAWTRLKEQGYARFLSTTAIRGISIDDSIIIVDECQNLNWSEVNTIMSRVGHRSKIIFCGDFKQTDLIKSNKDTTAFHDFRKVANDMAAFQEVYFSPDDIVRSSLVKQWIMSCERNNH
jgi:phosphate starvation-inducible PhoH-like protein